MKKLLFLGGLTYGGAERQMVVLAKAMADEGYDVTFLNTGNGDFYKKDLENANIKTIELKSNKIINKLKLSILQLVVFHWRCVRKEKIDTGISFLGECNFSNCIVSKLSHGKYRAITGLRNARNSLLLSRRELFFTRFEKYASLKVCNSENGLNLYKKNFPQFANKLTTIYNIIETPHVSTLYQVRKENKTYIIVAASYREVKNPYGLLDALSLMNDTEKEMFCITWYGDNQNAQLPYYVNLSKEVSKRGLGGCLTLKDATKEIADRMNESDVVALFSSSEGLPNAICEGMMLGKPIIMTRVSDYKILVDDSNGVLCDWDNPESIKDAVLAMAYSTKEELLYMGEQSKKKAVDLFSYRSAINQWCSII